MIWAFKQLLVPCNYLRIKQGETLLQSKAVYDLVLPAILTGATVGLSVVLSAPLTLAHRTVLADNLSELLALLIAFYMAALAAVSTFERKGIDNTLRGEDATLRVLDHDSGDVTIKRLTYRQFISYLFGYLSFLSLVLFVALIFFDGLWPKLTKAVDSYPIALKLIDNFLDPAIFAAFFFGLWQLFITSLLGIYFLADRMQTLNDPEN